MQVIPLSAIPNQSFSIRLGNSFYQIGIKLTNGVMCVSITRDSILIISNYRAVANTPIIPNRYQEEGNFAFLIPNDEYPNYKQFGVTQDFVYASPDELEVLRAGT